MSFQQVKWKEKKYNAPILTHREKMRENRQIRAKKQEVHERMRKARKTRDIYARSEQDFTMALTYFSAAQKRQSRSALNEIIRAQGIFGTADILGGSTSVLSAPMPFVAASMKHAREIMKGVIEDQRELNLAKGKTRAKAHAQRNPVRYSSWVKALGYDKESKVLYASLGDVDSGYTPKDYYWAPVGELVYIVWKSGQGRCKTEETGTRYMRSGKAPRWWKGASPSLGATWWYAVGKQLWGKAI